MRPVVGAHMGLGGSLYWQGKLEPALAHFQRGFEMFHPNMQFADWPGPHPAVACQFFPILISWMLGHPDRSLGELQAAVGSAETLAHPLTLAQALYYAAFIHIFRHDPPAAADYAGRALKICEEHRIAHLHGIAVCAEGWALRASGAHIPETLQDSLMARLDRAPRLREVAQLGSVLGREFAYDMISALAGIEEDVPASPKRRL